MLESGRQLKLKKWEKKKVAPKGKRKTKIWKPVKLYGGKKEKKIGRSSIYAY